MKRKLHTLPLIAFMAIAVLLLVACNGMAAMAVEPAAEVIQQDQVIQSEPRREASTVSESQAEGPIREPVTDTPIPAKVVLESTATLVPLPTETPVPTEIPMPQPEEVPIGLAASQPKAIIRFTCTEDTNNFQQDVVLVEYGTEVALNPCSNSNVEIIETAGEMNIANFQIGTTYLNRYLYRITTNLPEGATISAQRNISLESKEYFSGAVLLFSCNDGSGDVAEIYVQEFGQVQLPVEFTCTPYWGKIDTWEGIFTFTHESGEVVTLPTASNVFTEFNEPLSEWRVEYSLVPFGQ